jgi:hypothetical protein
VLSASVTLWLLLGVTLAFELAVLRRLAFDRVTVAIVLAGTALGFDYLTYTSIAERNYDGSSHLEYVRFIAEHGRLPDVFSCGVCGHPPLYYALAAAWSKVMSFGLPLEIALAWLSLLLFFGFAVFALLSIQKSTEDEVLRWLGAALVVFWPSSLLHSVRVHNDALASLLMLAALYWIFEWDRHGRERDFALALAASALSLFTKSSGYAVVAVLFVAVLLRLLSRQEPWRNGALRGLTSGGILALSGFLAVRLREARWPRQDCPSVLGSACGGRYVPPLPDTLERFVTFDPLEFVRRVEIDPLAPFPHRFLKSTLFGVQPLGEDFAGEPYATLAALMSALLLVMLLTCLFGALGLRASSLQKYRIYLVAPVILFAFLLAFRLRLPNEHHEDVRHIFPILPLFFLGYIKSVEQLGRRFNALRRAGVLVGLLMVTFSVAFFVRPP